MKTRSALVHFPGYPFHIEALLPNRQLASAAACLVEAGHETYVLDYGALSLLDRLFPERQRDAAQSLADRLLTSEQPSKDLASFRVRWQMRNANRAFREQLHRVCAEVAQEMALLVKAEALDFVLFFVNTPDDWVAARAIAAGISQRHKGVRLAVTGDLLDMYGEPVVADEKEFDLYCAGDTESSIASLAEVIHNPGRWDKAPSLLSRVNGRAGKMDHQPADLNTLPIPNYDADVYPAIHANEKLLLFTVEDGRTAVDRQMAGTGLQMRTRPIQAVHDEIRSLSSSLGAKAFHVSGPGEPGSHVVALAHTLIEHGPTVVYSRGISVCHTLPLCFPILRSSGCLAASFQIDTGSQRLLDDYYGRGVSISRAENVLLAAKNADVLTVVGMTYPSPADDYHTLCETLRFVERSSSEAATVAWPGSPLAGRTLRTLGPLNRFPLPPGRWQASSRCWGARSGGKTVCAHNELCRELERRDVLTQFPEILAVVAHFTHNTKRKYAMNEELTRAFMTGDIPSLMAFVERFNQHAVTPVKAMGFRPFVPMREAVGN